MIHKFEASVPISLESVRIGMSSEWMASSREYLPCSLDRMSLDRASRIARRRETYAAKSDWLMSVTVWR